MALVCRLARHCQITLCRFLSRYSEAFGETFRFYLGGLKEAIVTTNPAVIQHVLKTNAENYRKSEIQIKRMGHFPWQGASYDPWRSLEDAASPDSEGL